MALSQAGFGFMLTCKEGVDRNQVKAIYRRKKGVQTRMLFAGNLCKASVL